MERAEELADDLYHNNECGAIFIKDGTFANNVGELKPMLIAAFRQNRGLLNVFTEAVIESRGLQ